MLSADNITSLKLEITNILLERNKNNRKVQYEQILQHLEEKKVIFKTKHFNFTNEKTRSMSISITGDEIYALGSHLLVYKDGVISIYNYDNNLKMRKIRELKTHLLIFYIKTETICNESKNVMYNIILNLVEQRIKRMDQLLEDIVFYLNINKLSKMQIKNGYLICNYKDDSQIVYNDRLMKIDSEYINIEDERGNKKEFIEKFECNKTKLYVKSNGIEVNFKNKSFYEFYNIAGIRKCTYNSNVLFLLTEDKLLGMIFDNHN
ncbi:hypothetical protein COBT_000049 [Conglomerata obtusa]